MSILSNKLMILNLYDEIVGTVEKTSTGYITDYLGQHTETVKLPSIMQDIAPSPSQKAALPTILSYYGLDSYDIWDYLKRSNGFKTSRKIYFVAEPPGEIWVPLRGERDYTVFMNPGDPVVIRGNGVILVNKHRNLVLPDYLTNMIDIDSAVHGNTEITGYVHDVRREGLLQGLKARLVLNFPESSLKR